MDQSGGGRTLWGWASVGASFLLVVVAVVLLGVGLGGESDGRNELDEARLLRAQSTLEVASLETVSLRLFDAAGLDGDRGERLSAASARLTSSGDELSDLAADDQLAAAAATLADIPALDDPLTGDLQELFVLSDDLRWTVPAERMTAEDTAVHQLTFLAALPWHIAVEAVVAIADRDGEPIDSDAALFAESIVGVVIDEGGWLVPDQPTVLSGSTWFDIDLAQEYYPAEVAQIAAALEASDLLTVDRWMLDFDLGATPPVSIADVERATYQLASIVDPIVADALTERIVIADRVVGAQARDDRILVGLAGAAVALAVVAFFGGAWLIVRAHRWSRRRAELATRDALTGVANRYELDGAPRVMADDPQFCDHVAAVIDLDRFKMINDVHGHAIGDAVLVEVAHRLVAAAADVTEQHEAEFRVIRLGGDEFLVTLHGRTPLQVDRFRALLDGARTEPFETAGVTLRPEFSVGIARSDGPVELDQLMREADFAAYDNKAERAARRQRAALVLPPPPAGSVPPRTDLPAPVGHPS